MMRCGRILFIAGFFIAWEAIVSADLVSKLFFASPVEILHSIFRLFAQENFSPDLGATSWRVVLAFLISAGIGTPLGISIGYFRRAGCSIEVALDFLRSIPPIALFPLFIFFFGIGDASKIAVAAFSGTMIITIASFYGAKQINRTRLTLARKIGMNGRKLFLKVLLPESLPTTFGGYRLAASICLILVITTEMFLGTKLGMGTRLVDAHMLYDTGGLYALIIIAGILGYSINMVFSRLERKIVHWEGR
jgi:NitT/TauT family transport system permease protein